MKKIYLMLLFFLLIISPVLASNGICERADVNNDGLLTAGDMIDTYVFYHKNKDLSCSNQNNWCDGFDINKDKTVDFNDVLRVFECFNKQSKK